MSAVGSIGAFLTSLGNSKDDRRKEELAERLAKEREEREEERIKRREERAEMLEAKRVKEQVLRKNPDGSYVQEKVNSFGQVIERGEANPLDIDKINLDRRKDEVSIEQILANTASARANAAQTSLESQYLPGREARADRVANAQIENFLEPNHVESPTQDAKAQEQAILEKARAGIGKHAIVTDAKTKKRVRKLITAEFVAEQLRQAGYGYLADRLYKTDEEDDN